MKMVIFCIFLTLFLCGCQGADSEVVDSFLGSDDSGETGEFGNAAISFSPSSGSFGSEYVGDTSDTSTFQLTNISTQRITINSISVNDSNFNLVTNSCTALASNATCTISINFAPKSSGSFSASAIVNYTYSASNYTISLGFTGVAISDLSFGGVTLVDSVQSTTATAHWTHVTGAVSYFIFNQDSSGARTFLGSVNAPSDSFDLTSLSSGTDYTLEIQAVDFNSGMTDSNVTFDFTTEEAPVLTTINDFSFPTDNLSQNSAMTTVDVDNTVTSDDTNMTYACYFDKVVDGSVDTSSADNCTDLDGTATFNTATGVFDWTPNNNAFGSYEILIEGTLFSESSDTEIFVIPVRSNYSLTNILIDLDAQFSNYINAAAAGSTLATWRNIATSGSSYDGDLIATGLDDNWQGDGTYLDPYSLLFEGASGHYMDLGTSFNSQIDMMFSLWISPSNANELGTVILGNKGSGGDGFELRQSPDNAGKLHLMIGTTPANVPYATRVLNYSPVAYYRFDETTGSANAVDSSGTSPANNGTFAANVTLEETGAMADNDAIRFTGTNPSYIDVSDAASLDLTSNGLTLSAWIYLESTSSYRAILGKGTNPYDFLWAFNNGKQRQTLYLSTANATWNNDSSTDVPLNTWTHIAVSFDPSTKKLQYYMNGVPDGDYTTSSGTMVNTAADLEIGSMINHAYQFKGGMDELVIYNQVLDDAEVYNLFASNPIECESSTTISDNEWINVAATYDSGTDKATLYIDGEEECYSIYGNTFNPADTALTVGARSDGTEAWSGSIANLKLYSSGSASDISTLYFESKIPFIDFSSIVTDDLVLNLDASYANGSSYPGSGCSYTSWVDLSTNAFTGTLTNFASCDSESGWNGTGTSADPYRLDFNKTNPDDYVSFSNHNNLDIEDGITVMLWLNPDIISGYHGLIGKGTSPYNYLFSIISGTQKVALYTSINASWNNRNDTDLVIGSWQHIAATFDASTGELIYYYNGAEDGTHSLSSGTMATNDKVLEIGNMINSGYPYDGSISNVQIYDRPLSADEVYQNCLAHNNNFSGVICSQ